MSASIRSGHPKRPVRQARGGFTLIEILIVVVILGILAAIAIPQFSSATAESRQAMLKDQLRFLRSQLQVFRAQHRDVPAGYPGCDVTTTPDEATFVGHMTKYTDATGNFSDTESATFKFPPYLSRMPENPINKQSGILIVTGASLPAADNAQPYGWIYNPVIGKIVANLEGEDLNDVPYTNY